MCNDFSIYIARNFFVVIRLGRKFALGFSVFGAVVMQTPPILLTV